MLHGNLRKRTLGGVTVAALTREQFVDKMISDYQERLENHELKPVVSFSANGEMLSMCARDSSYAELIKKADFVDVDGQPIVIFSRFWPGESLPGRVATTDFFHDAARAAQEKNMTFYLLGASESVLQMAIRNINEMYPTLKIVGARNGYFEENEIDEVIADIKKTQPDVLWVGMGSPRQQKFCLYARDKLPGVTWIKSCGGLLDFLAGKNSRAPEWMQHLGLEWLYRLAIEPRRLFWRYATTSPHAIFLLFTRSSRE